MSVLSVVCHYQLVFENVFRSKEMESIFSSLISLRGNWIYMFEDENKTKKSLSPDTLLSFLLALQSNNLKGLLCVLIEWDKSLTCSQLILLIYAKEFLHPSWSEWNLIWTFPLRLNRFVDLLVWIYKEHLNFKFKAADRIWTENGLSRKHVTNFTLLWNLGVQYAWWSHCVPNGKRWSWNKDPGTGSFSWKISPCLSENFLAL